MTFLVVGEGLVDLIGEAGQWRFGAVAGGSPLNVAVMLAALGRPVRFAGEAGRDFFGDLLRAHLARHGVSDADIADADATGLAFARIGADGSARYDFRFTWRFSAPVRLAGVRRLHTGSLATLVEPGAARVLRLMDAAAGAGVPVSYDPNIRPALAGEHARAVAAVERCVRRADTVKASAEDLAWLYPGEPYLEVARRWAAMPHARAAARPVQRLVVVTLGEDGAVAVFGGRALACPAAKVEVADTVGAGDAFTAACLAALDGGPLSLERVAQALRRGCAMAAVVCTRNGAVPPAPGEVEAVLPRVPEPRLLE